jgi:hypothetical protein
LAQRHEICGGDRVDRVRPRGCAIVAPFVRSCLCRSPDSQRGVAVTGRREGARASRREKVFAACAHSALVGRCFSRFSANCSFHAVIFRNYCKNDAGFVITGA